MNINEEGYAILENFISNKEITQIINDIDHTTTHPKHGIRHANSKFSSVDALCRSKKLLNTAQSILKNKIHLVRVIFFDKTPENNWLVTWHQDKTISVDAKVDIEGWKAWSVKDQVHHVQPPIDVLNKMVTFRIHLDDATHENGCLKVIPKSHHLGILSQSDIDKLVQKEQGIQCEVKAGDALIMRPHILHSSSKSNTNKHRRVIHIEFSSYELPSDLNWV